MELQNHQQAKQTNLQAKAARKQQHKASSRKSIAGSSQATSASTTAPAAAAAAAAAAAVVMAVADTAETAACGQDAGDNVLENHESSSSAAIDDTRTPSGSEVSAWQDPGIHLCHIRS